MPKGVPIRLFHATTAGALPPAGSLTAGELALDALDSPPHLYTLNGGGTVIDLLSDGAPTLPLSIANGGTGATTGAGALDNLSGTSGATAGWLNRNAAGQWVMTDPAGIFAPINNPNFTSSISLGGTNLTGLFAALTNPANGQNNYAPLANPNFSGTVSIGGTALSGLFAPLTNPVNGQNNYLPIANPTFTGTLTGPQSNLTGTGLTIPTGSIRVGQSAIFGPPASGTITVDRNSAVYDEHGYIAVHQSNRAGDASLGLWVYDNPSNSDHFGMRAFGPASTNPAGRTANFLSNLNFSWSFWEIYQSGPNTGLSYEDAPCLFFNRDVAPFWSYYFWMRNRATAGITSYWLSNDHADASISIYGSLFPGWQQDGVVFSTNAFNAFTFDSWVNFTNQIWVGEAGPETNVTIFNGAPAGYAVLNFMNNANDLMQIYIEGGTAGRRAVMDSYSPGGLWLQGWQASPSGGIHFTIGNRESGEIFERIDIDEHGLHIPTTWHDDDTVTLDDSTQAGIDIPAGGEAMLGHGAGLLMLSAMTAPQSTALFLLGNQFARLITDTSGDGWTDGLPPAPQGKLMVFCRDGKYYVGNGRAETVHLNDMMFKNAEN